MGSKVFSLDEARTLMPTLRKLLKKANQELSEHLQVVHKANECYEQAEAELDGLADTSDLETLRSTRARFQASIESLSDAQTEYIQRLNFWVEKISSHGVILRDLREGLLDFPSRQNGFDYLLCWRADEKDINFWHLENDGFIGRKPLAALQEYC